MATAVVVIRGVGSNLGQGGQGRLEPLLSSPEKMRVVRRMPGTWGIQSWEREEHGPWGGTRGRLVKQPLHGAPAMPQVLTAGSSHRGCRRRLGRCRGSHRGGLCSSVSARQLWVWAWVRGRYLTSGGHFLLMAVTSSVVQVSGLASFVHISETVVEVHPIASPAADFMNCLSSLSLSWLLTRTPGRVPQSWGSWHCRPKTWCRHLCVFKPHGFQDVDVQPTR